MDNPKFANELRQVFENMENRSVTTRNMSVEKIPPACFLYEILENRASMAYNVLTRLMLTEDMEDISSQSFMEIQGMPHDAFPQKPSYSEIFETIVSAFDTDDTVLITSAHLLIGLVENDETTKKRLSKYGVTAKLLRSTTEEYISETVERKLKEIGRDSDKERQKGKKEGTRQTGDSKKKGKRAQTLENGETDRILVNLNKLSAEGKIEQNIGNEKTIESIFRVLAKKNRNNALVVGDSGIGKTSMVRHMANLLESGCVPQCFIGKQLMVLDFVSLTSGTGYKGAFETKFQSLVNDASKRGRYIFFLDDIHSILSSSSKFGEMSTESYLDMILSDKNICLICTTTNEGYSKYISTNGSLRRRFQKIQMAEKDTDEIMDIVKTVSLGYEAYHNVSYTEEAIEASVKLSSRFITDRRLPDSALDLLDECAAEAVIKKANDEYIERLEDDLKSVTIEKDSINSTSDYKEYDRYDELVKEEIRLKAEIAKRKKELAFNKLPVTITDNDIREILSFKTGIPVSEMSEDEREKLKNLSKVLSGKVIGQNEAINELCSVIKRQRAGLSNPNRPAVMLFSGSTGTGKTYLAKCVAEAMFGSEKEMVRIDMGEYTEKMSVNKLYGSSPGYVGYDEGGVLTEAIKKKPYCVLLLDEIEKANEEVFNVLLSVFDEGKLKDNKGNDVDFKNVIIIMTSNVGAVDVTENGAGIGFAKQNANDRTKEIIEKAIKRKFKPEFINRIGKIIYFNRLTSDDLKEVIRLEVAKVAKRVEEIGFKLSDEISNGTLIGKILVSVEKESEYGARPIIREIEKVIEEPITDYIIENSPQKGYEFKIDDIYLEN